MKPHLPSSLRAALLAALVAVSFTAYSSAWASTLTQTSVSPYGTWSQRITSSMTVYFYELVDISNKNGYTSGGAIYYYDSSTLSFTSNDGITFKNNTASASAYGTSAYGGAIYNGGPLSFTANGDITFKSNMASASASTSQGGAIYNYGSLSFKDNWDINFESNTVYTPSTSSTYGGAIDNRGGTLTFTDNRNITFSGNSVSSNHLRLGGAIHNSASGTLSFTGNDDITFSRNSASNGGSIDNDEGTLSFTGNDDITFSDNSASSCGGAINNDHISSLSFEINGDITFSGNSASTFSTGGGAIFNSDSGTLNFAGNGDITFSGNSASSYNVLRFPSYGGAIYNSSALSFEGNGDVTFSGNTADDHGGAIYNSRGTLSFTGNGDVTFQGNFERAGSQLRGLYSGSGTVTLSATTGKSITFYDSVYTSSSTTLELNKSYVDAKGSTVAATGAIVFSGATTKADLAAAFARNNISGAATAEQILASRTSEIGKAATLYAGSLEVRDKAVLNAAGITVRASAGTKGGTRIVLNNGTLNSNVTLAGGTSLQLTGGNMMTGTLSLADGAGLTFNLNGYGDGSLLTLTGTLVQNGAIKVSVAGNLKGGRIALISADARRGDWTAAKVKVTGVKFSDLVWSGNTLYYVCETPTDTVLVWNNATKDGKWADSSANWAYDGEQYSETSACSVTFGNTAAGTVTLVGDQSAVRITVNNSSGKNYTFSGSGRITGASTLVKTGAGSLTISTANTYTGGTTVNAGTLSAKNVKALGTGAVTMTGGTLHLNSLAVANAINVNGDSALKGGAKYAGNLTLTKGTLTGDKINLTSGKTATLKSGSLENVLAGAGKVVKDTTGTAYLYGANTYTGGTTVKAGTLSAKNVKALGTGSITLSGGTLHLNSLAVANVVNANGTASLKGGTKYAGNLTLTKGTLSGDKINLASGKTATLKSGTLKNVFSGAGKVVKDTAGTVTLNGANTYTGGTTVKAGTLSTKNVKALGTKTTTLTGGTLHLNSLAVANAINANGTASLKGGTKYAGNLTLTKGTLSGDKINLASGKTSTLKAGTLKNVLAGAGKVVKDTTGTVTLNGTNTYTGGTTVKAGTLSTKNVKALGTKTATLTGGTLHLNSLAVANDINVNATSATIKGGTKYKGKLTLTKGTLTGDKLNITSGKNAYLKSGTVKNALGGNGHVYKQGTGTVTLSGTNNWTGNTYVQGGTLVISGATTLRGTTRTYANSKLDVRRAVTMGNLYLGGGTLALKAGNTLTVTGTLTLANATKLALSGVTSSSPVLIKYGKLSNTSGQALAKFFGLSSSYKISSSGGKLTVSVAGSKPSDNPVTPSNPVGPTGPSITGAPAQETAYEVAVDPNALGQSTWGTARAARLFDHTVRDHAQAQSVALDKNRSVWFAGMSGFSHVDDAADTNIYGGAVGMQFNGTLGGNAGIAIGQTYGHVSPAGATRVKQQTQHAALYGTKMLYTSATDSVSLTGTASYGTTDADHEGYDWTQHSAVLGVRGTWAHMLNKTTAAYGFAGLEYLATDSEAGSGSIQTLQGSIGAGISHTEGRLTVHADVSFTPDMVRNAPSTTVSTGRLGFEVGAGASYRISDQWSINAGYTYHNEKRADSHEAYIGARCTF